MWINDKTRSQSVSDRLLDNGNDNTKWFSKHNHHPRFRVLFDFIFGNYEGNYVNKTTMNNTVSRTKSYKP